MVRFIILLCYVFLVPVSMGYLLKKFLGNKDKISLKFWCEGFILELGSFGIVWGFVLILNRDFHEICEIYIGISALSAIIALFLWIHEMLRRKVSYDVYFHKIDAKLLLAGGVFLAIFFFQVIKSGDILETYEGDNMAIYVSTIVSDHSLYKSNPLTGILYNAGEIKMNYSLLTVFYAFLVFVSGINTITIVYKLIPIWILCLFYSMQYSIGADLFGNNKQKIFLYCIVIEIVNIFGTTKHWMLPAFVLLHPWTDAAMLSCLLLPMLVWTAIKLVFSEKTGGEQCMLLILLLTIGLEDFSPFYMIAFAIIILILWLVKRKICHE